MSLTFAEVVQNKDKLPEHIAKRIDAYVSGEDSLVREGPNGVAYLVPHPITLHCFEDMNVLARKTKRKPKDSFVWSLPTHAATDYDYLVFIDDLIKTFNKEPALQPSLDEYGLTGENGIKGGIDGLRHIPGFPAKNPPVPLVDNAETRLAEGLNNELTEQQEAILRSVTRLFVRAWEPAVVPVKTGKSSSSPLFTTDIPSRQEVIEMGAAIQSAYIAGEYKSESASLMEDGLLYPYAMVFRNQTSDSVKYVDGKYVFKDRPTWDLNYSLGHEGAKKGVMDKHISVEDLLAVNSRLSVQQAEWISARFGRTRLRVANGQSANTSGNAGHFWLGVTAGVLKIYAKTFHDRTDDERVALARESAQLYMDVSNHDLLFAACVTDVMYDEITKVLPEVSDYNPEEISRFVELLQANFFAPRLAFGIDNEDEDAVLFGDLNGRSTGFGMASGNFGTFIIGCIEMMTCYIDFLCRYVPECELAERIAGTKFEPRSMDVVLDSFMKHELSTKLKIKSDDSAGGISGQGEEQARDIVRRAVEDETVCYDPSVDIMKLGFEIGAKYLGPLASRTRSGSIVPNPDPTRIFPSLFAHEYGTLSEKQRQLPYEDLMPLLHRCRRKFPGLGTMARLNKLRENMFVGSLLVDLIEEVYYKHFNSSFLDDVRRWEREDEILLEKYTTWLNTSGLVMMADQKFANLTKDEILYMSDPDKQYSQLNIDDVRPEIIDMVEGTSTNSLDLSKYYKLKGAHNG